MLQKWCGISWNVAECVKSVAECKSVAQWCQDCATCCEMLQNVAMGSVSAFYFWNLAVWTVSRWIACISISLFAKIMVGAAVCAVSAVARSLCFYGFAFLSSLFGFFAFLRLPWFVHALCVVLCAFVLRFASFVYAVSCCMFSYAFSTRHFAFLCTCCVIMCAFPVFADFVFLWGARLSCFCVFSVSVAFVFLLLLRFIRWCWFTVPYLFFSPHRRQARRMMW